MRKMNKELSEAIRKSDLLDQQGFWTLRNRVIYQQREEYDQTFKEIGEIWGMTPQRARQIYERERYKVNTENRIQKLREQLGIDHE